MKIKENMQKSKMNNQNLKGNRNDDSEQDDDFNQIGPDFVLYSAQRKQLTNLHLDLDEEVREPRYYRPFIRHLDNLEEDDQVSVHLKTYGGSYDGALALIQAFNSTEATVVAFIEGHCDSAGSIIALSCPNIVVSPFATMLCHTAKYGTGGSILNVQKYSSFMIEQIHSTMEEVYKDFLTEDELARVLAGEEFIFNAKEISKRLKKKFNLQEKRRKALTKPRAKNAKTGSVLA